VERSSNFTFLYRIGLLDTQRKVDLEAKGVSVEYILDRLLAGTGVSYRVLENNLVILMESDDKALRQIMQGVTVTGTVSAESGETLPGVNVVEKGAGNGTVTNADGKFTIRVMNADAVLTFSFVGYATQEIVVGNRQTLSVTMAEDARQLEEV